MFTRWWTFKNVGSKLYWLISDPNILFTFLSTQKIFLNWTRLCGLLKYPELNILTCIPTTSKLKTFHRMRKQRNSSTWNFSLILLWLTPIMLLRSLDGVMIFDNDIMKVVLSVRRWYFPRPGLIIGSPHNSEAGFCDYNTLFQVH